MKVVYYTLIEQLERLLASELWGDIKEIRVSAKEWDEVKMVCDTSNPSEVRFAGVPIVLTEKPFES